MSKTKKYLDIFWTFFKIGLFTFGGGYVMLGIMQTTLVDKKKWLTEDEMFDLIAISESTPGPFAINAATFIGYKRANFIGSFFATLGTVLPSFVIILIVSYFLNAFESNLRLQNFLKGIQAGVGVLIFSASGRLAKKLEKSLFNILLFFLGVIVALFTNFSLIYLLLILAFFGIASSFAQKEKAFNKEPKLSDKEEDSHDNY
ncbi:MAG: chromate transporter [Acholeplasmataceae bacterium]|nr:chromate transporter [Acholeplasmataceae bacterium]